MIQPIFVSLPATRLFAFESNKKIAASDVKNRLNHIKEKLTVEGIQVPIYLTDGDYREMKVIRNQLPIGASFIFQFVFKICYKRSGYSAYYY